MSSTTTTAMQQFDLHIAGASHPGSAPRLPTLNPYTSQPWASIAQATPSDVDLAITAATNALPGWSATPGVQRAKLLLKLADLIEASADILSEIESTDNGKIRRETHSQMFFSARCFRFFAGLADKLTGETKQLDNHASAFDFTLREPVGVCALITPWNSPISILTSKLAPCLACGNTCVVKPSEFTTASTLFFAGLVKQAGFPDGVVNVVSGMGEVGSALVSHPGIAKVSFTGSVNIGRVIAKQAAENIVPCTLELGGKSANILLGDANLERAVPGCVAGIFAASGQTCIAGSRVLVQREILEEVTQGILEAIRKVRFGDPLSVETDIGPVAHKGQWESVVRHIEEAEGEGAELLAGGRKASEEIGGLFIAPTVFGNVKPDSKLAQTEVFGPVLALIPFDTEEEAVRIANNTKFGLAAGIWTENIRKGHLMARKMNAGSVWVNTYRAAAAQAPFGGFGQSGYGKERGVEALAEYTRVKNVMLDLGNEVKDPFTLKL